MKKIIKLTEKDLSQIVSKVISEQMNYVQGRPPLKIGDNGKEVEEYQQRLLNLGYNLGPKGADGFFGKRTQAAVADFQKNRDLRPTGQIDQQTRNYLGLASPEKIVGFTQKQAGKQQPLFPNGKTQTSLSASMTPTQKGKTPATTAGTAAATKGGKGQPQGSKVGSKQFSSQVNRQLDYMKKNGLLTNDRFTILDDKNNVVHAFNPNYQLYKTYYVITGKNVGDELKTQSMADWALDNWNDVGAKFFSSVWKNTKDLVRTGNTKNFKPLQDVADYIDGCYFNQEQWRIKNTPSGVFKRAGLVQNFMNDWLATTFIAKDYGSRFVTWETCNGETIPFGFHGTQSTSRTDVLPGGKDFSKQQCKRRQMSFGCINFADADVKDISSFITAGQLSIWLPDASDNIVEIPSTCATGSGQQQSIMSYDYMTQKYGKGFK